MVTWLREPEDSGAARVQARYRRAGAGWGGIATLSPVEANSPVAAIDATGSAGRRLHRERDRLRCTPGRGSVGRPGRIGRHVEPPQVAVDDAGDIVVVWEAFVPSSGVFGPQAVTRPVGGPWSDPVTLDSDGLHRARGRRWTPWHQHRRLGRAPTAGRWCRPHPVDGAWSSPSPSHRAGDRAVPVPPYLQIRVGRSGAAAGAWTRQRGDAPTSGRPTVPPSTPG